MAQCQCLTKCGQQCKNSAKPESNFCTTHKNCGQLIKKVDTTKTADQMDAISIISISGTDPTQETLVEVYLCKHELVNKKIRSILIDLYQEFIDNAMDGFGENPHLKDEYQKILNILLESNQRQVKYINYSVIIPYDPVIKSQISPSAGYGPGYNPAIGLYSKFNWPTDDLVALDYFSPWETHYFLQVVENITDDKPFYVTIHEH